MALAKRIVPALDVKNGRVVKGINFLNLQDVGDPVDTAIAYQNSGADELVFLDISATLEGRTTMIEMIERVSSAVFIPLTAGGGVTDLASIRAIIQAGADKVFLNSAAVTNPDIIRQGAEAFGSQAIVGAIDSKWNDNLKKHQVYVSGGTKATNLETISWAKKMVQYGAGELLVTSMNTDGTQNGYDIALYQSLTQAVNVPIIASGGAGKKSDFKTVFKSGHADAALAASVFHYGKIAISDLKESLYREGLVMRL
ncbi:imidazole glycerol phosphate synthase subunit HisF [Leuconostoc gelidum subsp. gasicomitatum]|uniref:imidazole glycerol phosphate synthase subunit HisF n=1 Tax=Leuconostoc gasicomitatum TaxID=115778 RepID=UPI001CC7B721|nr:imidazole glycerol phosphate synthase subunit HisF [Leuconostoc gasicomitatum]MBZ5996101.1 imidazole glycerol phosphate synthase subunit HisF [Leuconostoc gasicomitatum]